MQPLKKHTLTIDGIKIVCESVIRTKNAVILHGAGNSSRTKYYPIAQEILRNGVGVVLFDFAGHGESGGSLSKSSLEQRKTQAKQIIDSLIPLDSPLYLFGFSMSGQTVCNLLPVYNKRIESILLACPAIYSREVSRLKFGDINFTRKIRAQNSWESSAALSDLETFEGKTCIAIGEKDEVIPKSVIELLQKAAQHADTTIYPDVTHQLALWLNEHPIELSALISKVLAY
jgi:pimeloyl-ACP methyl ester carboxylesterase